MGSPGSYLSLDQNRNMTAFQFVFDYQLTYYPRASFVPCRCIKE